MSKETRLQYSARNACGYGAAYYGEDTPAQWDYLAKWAGFDTWEELVEYEKVAKEEIRENIEPPFSNKLERARAAIERRNIWDKNTLLFNERQRLRVKYSECPHCGNKLNLI